MMAFVAFQGFGVVDVEDLLVLISHEHHFFPAFDALLGALGGSSFRPFGATLFIAHPTRDVLCLTHLLARISREAEGNYKTSSKRNTFFMIDASCLAASCR